MSSETTILIIDRTRRDRERWRRRLERYAENATQVVFATGVADALEVRDDSGADCILLSSRVRDFSFDAIASVSGRYDGVRVPVILLLDDPDSANEALDAGAYGFIVKDRVDQPEARCLLKNALDSVALRRTLEAQRRAIENGSGGPPKFDAVTELPTRHEMRARLAKALSTATADTTTGAILIGLDGFKAINSAFGHGVGDALLRMVAERLRHCVRNVDTVARWGGDEFAAVLEGMSRPHDAIFIAERIMYSLSRPFAYRGQDLYVTASVGIAVNPADGHDAETLLQHADAAMYRVKSSGGNNYRVYSANMNEKLSDRLAVGNRLRSALARDEFLLHYQPQIDLDSGRVIGLEALLRWNDSKTGMRSPAEFIPVLEETGLIVPVGEWVLRRACEQARAWRDAGLEDVRVAVNLSPKQFRQRELVNKVATILDETGLHPSSLEVELTESVLMDDQDYAKQVLRELKNMGSYVALDDFGVGYSSLGFLKAFPVDTLKIDRTFIRDIAEDEDDRSICSAIVSLGKALRLRVLAEGVEDDTQVEILKTQGCHFVQGYLYARPMSADDAWSWLTAETASPVGNAE